MLSPVKIFDGKGNLKEIVTKEMVEDRYWKGFKTNNHIFAVEGSTPNFQLSLKKVTCRVCKNIFETTHAKTLYCGRECAHKMVEIKRKQKIKTKKEAQADAKLNNT